MNRKRAAHKESNQKTTKNKKFNYLADSPHCLVIGQTFSWKNDLSGKLKLSCWDVFLSE